MIGFLLVMVATTMFMLLGYTLFAGAFFMFMNVTIIIALIGMIFLAISGALWEWYFQKPAKDIIANKRCAAWELAVDDLGYGQLVPSKKYMPQGLVEWRFGWSLLPRPIKKLEIVQQIFSKRRGRPPKDPEKAKQSEAEHQAREMQLQEIEQFERELAEQIGLKKVTWKGIGKPLWLSYLGLAANFNPYILVPGEAKQDNPHQHISLMRSYIQSLDTFKIKEEVKADLLTKVNDLETRLDHIRVVLDPRRSKEIMPQMYTQGQVDDHGRIHQEIGRLSVSGIPMGKILIILLVIVGVIGAIAAIYFLFLKPQPQQVQQTAALIANIHQKLLNR